MIIVSCRPTSTDLFIHEAGANGSRPTAYAEAMKINPDQAELHFNYGLALLARSG
jgi:Tfp pilus assembly protein PilF